MKQDALIVNGLKDNSIRDCLSIEPVFSSYKYLWNDISLVYTETEPTECPAHYCPHHVIAIITKRTEVEVFDNGKMYPRIYEVGDICFHPAYALRKTYFRSGTAAINISLDPLFVSKVDPEFINPDTVELAVRSHIQDPLICQLGCALKNEVASGYPSKVYVDSLATCLSAHLLQKYSAQEHILPHGEGGLAANKLKLVTDYINDHLPEEISLKMLAGLTGMSQYHFGRLFKQSIGLSPYKYILQQRINLAKQLLTLDNIGIAEVALNCGFTHQSHLNRHFKNFVGTTPKKYRNSFN
ncbi:AraC family transcriptional regulator [Acaryochloris sp. IP29b_bin.148]|uniref:helix-turn-helix domain-containing protein n=1 Tax=Acaryochloris sp. IP29b_bin.148 TaxID=2969218 RepID=UPI002634148F|nr:AraC family transcriptional regulator [Acaryochloris sp. IP29b_bin.148]